MFSVPQRLHLPASVPKARVCHLLVYPELVRLIVLLQEEAAMQSFLERVELEKYFPAMKSLGVKSLSDFDQVQTRPPQCCRVLHNAPHNEQGPPEIDAEGVLATAGRRPRPRPRREHAHGHPWHLHGPLAVY